MVPKRRARAAGDPKYSGSDEAAVEVNEVDEGGMFRYSGLLLGSETYY